MSKGGKHRYLLRLGDIDNDFQDRVKELCPKTKQDKEKISYLIAAYNNYINYAVLDYEDRSKKEQLYTNARDIIIEGSSITYPFFFSLKLCLIEEINIDSLLDVHKEIFVNNQYASAEQGFEYLVKNAVLKLMKILKPIWKFNVKLAVEKWLNDTKQKILKMPKHPQLSFFQTQAGQHIKSKIIIEFKMHAHTNDIELVDSIFDDLSRRVRLKYKTEPLIDLFRRIKINGDVNDYKNQSQISEWIWARFLIKDKSNGFRELSMSNVLSIIKGTKNKIPPKSSQILPDLYNSD